VSQEVDELSGKTNNTVTLVALIAGGVLSTAAFFMTWFYAPMSLLADRSTYDFAQKIFYFHVPVAESSFLVFGFAAYYGIRFLMTKKREYDIKARVAMEVTMLFVALTMATGILWTRAEWNVWWVWEPRLTTYFILTLLVIGYFVLRNSVEDEERRATYAAVFSIIAFLDAPLSFIITRVIGGGEHPIVFGGGPGTGLEPAMLVTFIVAQIGILLFAYAMFQIRMREEHLSDRLESTKVALGG
jgi:heme exporter protein C